MAEGLFDPLLVSGAWFDDEIIAAGWFDEDLIRNAAEVVEPVQPLLIVRGGGKPDRDEYEKRQKEWRDDLKRIIEDAFVTVAGGTTEPVTVAEKQEIAAAVLPVADMSGIQASLTEIMRLVNEYEAERRRKAEEEDDELLLLLAA